MNPHTAVKPRGIGLKESSRDAVLEILDRVLADENVLTVKTRRFHWNVTGINFDALHKFFEAQYGELAGVVDEVAERSRALGGRALGSMREFLDKTRLEESSSHPLKDGAMLAELLADHETVIRSLRADVDEAGRLGDQGTADFLTGLMARHEKMAWMLRSFVS